MKNTTIFASNLANYFNRFGFFAFRFGVKTVCVFDPI